jgi:hypothetical protein
MAAILESNMSVFGFSTEPSTGGDFTPVAKYDGRAGRIFRMDRVEKDGSFSNEPVDITSTFKAVADFENLETGWINFPSGSAPEFSMAPVGAVLPARPSPRHKNGVRFMLKLSKDCGGDKPIREMASTARVFLTGLEAVYSDYLAQRADNPGKLPVIVLKTTVPIKSSGKDENGKPVSSTNYQPTFEIVSWAARGDLTFQPKSDEGQKPLPASLSPSAPSTGSKVVGAPQAKQPELEDADEFG